MTSLVASIIRGYTNGYAAGDQMKQRKEEREERRAQREAQEQEKQEKKDYARQIAANLGTVGQPKEVDAGGGYKFNGPDATGRAAQFIADNNDPEFGIAAQGVNTQPLNEKPQAQGIYSRKDELQDRVRLAGQVGDIDEVKAARKELANLYSEGVGQALMAFRNGGPEEAIKVYNEYGLDRLENKFEKLDKGFKLFRQDGTSFDVDPEELELSQLDLLKRAQLLTEKSKSKAYDALADQRKQARLSPGQIIRDTETGELVAEGLPKPPPAARGGVNGGGPKTDNSARYRLETLRKLAAQNDKIIGDTTSPPDAIKAAAARNEKLNQEIDSMIFGESSPPNPEAKKDVVPPPSTTGSLPPGANVYGEWVRDGKGSLVLKK